MLKIFALATLTLISVAARSATIDIGRHRTLQIDVPKEWKLWSMISPAGGCLITIKPSDKVNAEVKLSTAFFQHTREIDSDKLDDALAMMCEPHIEGSVEKKKTFQDFGLAKGYGRFCTFTDESLVGKTSPKDEFKVLTLGIVQVSNDVLVCVAIALDDLDSPLFGEMKRAVSSIQISDAQRR